MSNELEEELTEFENKVANVFTSIADKNRKCRENRKLRYRKITNDEEQIRTDLDTILESKSPVSLFYEIITNVKTLEAQEKLSQKRVKGDLVFVYSMSIPNTNFSAEGFHKNKQEAKSKIFFKKIRKRLQKFNFRNLKKQ